MKYIQGTTNKEYYIDGVVLPRKYYSAEARAKGRDTVVCLSDDRWAKLSANAVVQELIAGRLIFASDTPPVTAENAAARAEQELIAAKANAQSEINAAKAETDKIKAEAIAELKSQAEEIERLKAQLKKKNKSDKVDLSPVDVPPPPTDVPPTDE